MNNQEQRNKDIAKHNILKEIEILTKVVEVNRGWLGDEIAQEEANNRIKELIKKL